MYKLLSGFTITHIPITLYQLLNSSSQFLCRQTDRQTVAQTDRRTPQ